MKRELSKEYQIKLMWAWNDDPNLELIYKTFDNYVKSRCNMTIPPDHKKESRSKSSKYDKGDK